MSDHKCPVCLDSGDPCHVCGGQNRPAVETTTEPEKAPKSRKGGKKGKAK